MQYIIDFIDSASAEDITDYCTRNACTVVKSYDHFAKTYLVEAAASPAVETIVEAVVENSAAPMQLLAVETKSFPVDETDNWWKAVVLTGIDLNQPTATIARAGQGARVYIMDSGIKSDHAEFMNKDVTLLHSVIPGDFSDTTGHGTAIASLIVGETCGITDAAVKVVKIFHNGHATLLSELVDAFDAVATDYIAAQDFLAVLNLSWSIEKNTYVESKIASLIDLGIYVIASAGNEGRPVGDVTPASMTDVVTVGSIGQDLAPSDFSNYTATDSDVSFTGGQTNFGGLDCFAPGEALRIALPDGTYGVGMGTSFAAAITSAITALRIKSSGYQWALGDAGAQDFVNAMMMRDILTLAGNYGGSPNAVPTTNISTLAGRVRSMRLFPVPAGETRHVWLLDGNMNSDIVITGCPSWVELVGSQLKFTAPASTTNDSYRGTVSFTNGVGAVEEHDFVIVVMGDSEESFSEYAASIPVEFTFQTGDVGVCTTQCNNQGQTYCCSCCGTKAENSECTECSNIECADQACL